MKLNKLNFDQLIGAICMISPFSIEEKQINSGNGSLAERAFLKSIQEDYIGTRTKPHRCIRGSKGATSADFDREFGKI